MLKIEIGSSFLTLHKTQIKLDQGPQHRPKILYLIEEKVGNMLIGTRKDILNEIFIVQALRPAISKWELMKLKGYSKGHHDLGKG